MLIKVIKVSEETKEKGKAKWTEVNVVFHNSETGKVDGRIIRSFGDKDVFGLLRNAQRDDVFDLTEAKNEKGYNEITKAVKKDAGDFVSREVAPATTTPARGNYETSEERAKRQELIVRQSAISSAVSLLAIGAEVRPSVDDVLRVASQFYDHVFQKPDPVRALIDMDNDIPE